jgi:3',5'-cyclic AMP phosphodiesterase CpdA
MKALLQKYKVEAFWVMGNHDGKVSLRNLFPGGQTSYFVDQDGWRLVVIDTNVCKSLKESQGCITAEKLEWVREVITSSEVPVVVAMHHPIFKFIQNLPGEVFDGYKELEKVFSESGKVKYVLSGHAHVDKLYSSELNNVTYYTNPPLCLKGNLGNYQVIEIGN